MTTNPSSAFGFIPKTRITPAGSSLASLRADVQYVAPLQLLTVTSESTVGNVTHLAEEVLGGLILRDCNGGARTDTLPTAALLVAAFKGIVVGSGIRLIVRNTSDAAETLTMAVGAGMTSFAGNTLTVAQNQTAEYMIVFTNVTTGNEACSLYTLGSANVH